MEEKSKPKLKYRLELRVDGKSVGLKPFIYNSFGNVVNGLVIELKDIPENPEVVLDFNPSVEKNRLTMSINGVVIECHEFVQDLFIKTIVGFISSLKGFTDGEKDLLNLSFNVKISKR